MTNPEHRRELLHEVLRERRLYHRDHLQSLHGHLHGHRRNLHDRRREERLVHLVERTCLDLRLLVG
ncbi:hypothetical protein RRF57_003011 [Xylaria bambusicola]|uniref:Uncharacterized protein n=1 Tax=Xylaria bambusicola TaxID=326684 RepID=A0AAN7UL41_9PEZI